MRRIIQRLLPVALEDWLRARRLGDSALPPGTVRLGDLRRVTSNQTGRIDRSTDPFALPRLFIRDWDGDQFAAVLRDHGVRI